MIPKAREVRLKPKVRKVLEARCRAPTTAQRDVKRARKFMTTVLNLPQVRSLLSSEHFSVDGTLIEAWASMKSFVPKDGSRPPSSGNGSVGGGGRNAARDFHGEKRANATHFST